MCVHFHVNVTFEHLQRRSEMKRKSLGNMTAPVMNRTAFEHTVVKDMALIEWVLRCLGKIGSYVSISQLLDKICSTERKRKWRGEDRVQMEISKAC
jgi:hypothetical protein